MPYSTTRGDPNDPDTITLRNLYKRKEDVIADDIKREKNKHGVVSNRLSLYSMYICNDEMISEPQKLTNTTPKRTDSSSPLNSSRTINSSPIQTHDIKNNSKNSLRWSDESPKRGRLRPSTAPNSFVNQSMNSYFSINESINMKDNYDENDVNNNNNNNNENIYNNDDDNLIINDNNDNDIVIDENDEEYEKLKKLLSKRKKIMALSLNTTDPFHSFKGSSSPLISPSPTFRKDGSKRVNYPNVSTKFLKKQSQMKQLQDKALDAIIFQEARLFQHRVTECIKEANLFADILGKSIRYKIVARDQKEDTYWEKIVKSNKEKKFPDEILPTGTANRLNKMSVQIIDDDNNTNRFININKFFNEHSDLHMEMKLHGSLIPTNEINKFSSPLKKGKGQTNLMKSQSIVSESITDFGGVKINFSDGSTNKKETKVRTRKDVLNDLKDVTDMVVINVKTLEKQLNEFQKRGWNKGVA